MLQALRIRNFAIINDLTLEFGPGFNVLSGETGAGKSVIIQALALLLGSRGFSDLIRKGEKEAVVEGGFLKDKKQVILSRLLNEEGRHKILINAHPATLASLQTQSQPLIDLATQHENQSLLQPARHREILDLFGGLETEKKNYQERFRRCQEWGDQKKKFLQKVEETRKEEDFLQFQLQEICAARLEEGEEEKLLQEREVAKHAVRLGESVTRIESILYSGEDNLTDRLSGLSREMAHLVKIDPKLGAFSKNFETALAFLQETGSGLKGYGEALQFDPDHLQFVEERLDLLKRLKKKYGSLVKEILKKEKELKEDLNRLEDFDQILKDIEGRLTESEGELKTAALSLRKKRKEAAAQLASLVEKELLSLGMGKIQFVAAVEPLTEGVVRIGEDFFDPEGGEGVEFLMAPNAGEGIRPMARIASGGELARILLALKTILGETREVATYVFDEVDVGVGGAAAEAVGRSLQRLSKKAQVIVITHLPQIACLADHHFAIRKEVKKGRTLTAVTPLLNKAREEEIARMLAGFQITDNVRAHARELLKGTEP
ncbi:MAG: DNA repair protein RecN [Deltaproteobacteria bacterium]|nr:DNA repair protein RecN [Deltaproteobacteria bacterium]